MNKLITTKSAEILADNYCRQCGARVGYGDNFCRSCGTGCHGSSGEVATQNAPPESSDRNQMPATKTNQPANHQLQVLTTVLNKRWLVIGIIALIGPMGLPALWFSPRFSGLTKVITTAMYVVLSAAIPILLVWYFLDYSMYPLVDAFGK